MLLNNGEQCAPQRCDRTGSPRSCDPERMSEDGSMHAAISLPDLSSRATLILGPEDRLTDDQYFAFCMANPDLNVERTAQGEIVIVPPAGGESDYRNADVIVSLGQWARKDGRGKTFGPTAQFLLPDGSGLSPDAAWVSSERIATLSKKDLRQFPHIVPEFVIEVMSPSDRLNAAKKKMRVWAKNGVDLGWLIDGDNQCVYVYRGSEEPRMVKGTEIAGEGPVEGFVLPLTEIWQGL
jgi:Uma2 family endonuclease